MKIKYKIKEFDPNIISVGDWVYAPNWHGEGMPKYIYKVCNVYDEKVRITVDKEIYEYPNHTLKKVNPKDIDKFILHE